MPRAPKQEWPRDRLLVWCGGAIVATILASASVAHPHTATPVLSDMEGTTILDPPGRLGTPEECANQDRRTPQRDRADNELICPDVDPDKPVLDPEDPSRQPDFGPLSPPTEDVQPGSTLPPPDSPLPPDDVIPPSPQPPTAPSLPPSTGSAVPPPPPSGAFRLALNLRA
jgi:hypothetical protein